MSRQVYKNQLRLSRFLIRTVTLFLLCYLIISLVMINPPEKSGGSQPLYKIFEKTVPELMEAYQIPGTTLALVEAGKPAWSGAFGLANIDTRQEMTVDTYCRVESISKSVTAWGVMRLVEQGKIDLDRPAADYLKNWSIPDSPFDEEQITVHMLLSNRSGMPLGTIGKRYDPRGEYPTLTQRLNNDAILIQEPGQSFSYSNTGFNLLEMLIEEVTGRTFSEYMRNEVLHPLGMNNATFEWSDTLQPPVPYGYGLDGNAIPEYVYPDKASGGLFATVEDIARFVAAATTVTQETGSTLLAPKYTEKLFTPAVPLTGYYKLVYDHYGLGHFIESLPNGMRSVAHGGQGSGWMTHFQVISETGDGIVILTNSQRSWPFIAHLISIWADSIGISSIGMGAIITASHILWVLIGLLLFLTFWLFWDMVAGLFYGRRHFIFRIPITGLASLGKWLTTLLIFSILIWASMQEYLFINSVFPVGSQWLGWALLSLATSTMASLFIPKKRVAA